MAQLSADLHLEAAPMFLRQAMSFVSLQLGVKTSPPKSSLGVSPRMAGSHLTPMEPVV